MGSRRLWAREPSGPDGRPRRGRGGRGRRWDGLLRGYRLEVWGQVGEKIRRSIMPAGAALSRCLGPSKRRMSKK